jgi:rod shape-determining protein MreD
MRFAVIIIGVVFSVVLQATWLSGNNLPFLVKPDLILVIVISYALLKGPYLGTNIGLFAGFFMDLAAGNIIGVGALCKMLAGFSAGLLEKTIFKDNLLVPVIAVFFGTVIFETLALVIHLSFGANLHFLFVMVHTVLPAACYNAVLAPLIYFLINKFENYASKKNQ